MAKEEGLKSSRSSGNVSKMSCLPSFRDIQAVVGGVSLNLVTREVCALPEIELTGHWTPEEHRWFLEGLML